MFRPVNNACLDCGKKVDPTCGRQEIVFAKNQCRRRCGACIKTFDDRTKDMIKETIKCNLRKSRKL